MPLQRFSGRRIVHPNIPPPLKILSPEAVPDWDRKGNTCWHELFDDTYVSPSTLYELSLHQPPLDVMKQLIRNAYKDQSLSPGFMDAVLMSLTEYQIGKDTNDPMDTTDRVDTRRQSCIELLKLGPLGSPLGEDIEAIEPSWAIHIPGNNDLMHGAMSVESEIPQWPIDDSLDCADNIHDQLNHMPWRILNAEHLVNVPGLFQNPEGCFAQLGESFLTTNEGLSRAIADCRNLHFTGDQMDTMVIGALARRGGFIKEETQGRSVVYPEDMYPIIGANSELFDRPYWEAMSAQSEIWYIMPD